MKLITILSVLFALSVTTIVHAAERPNVILILTDDQGYGDLAVHGNPVLEDAEHGSARKRERTVHRLSRRADVLADSWSVDDGNRCNAERLHSRLRRAVDDAE